MCPYKFEQEYEKILDEKRNKKEEFFEVPETKLTYENLFKWFKKINNG